MKTVFFTLNGQPAEAEEGISILQAARQHGARIPTLCHNDALHTTGSCWMCIVEIRDKNRFVPSCSTLLTEGMSIETDTPELFGIRKKNLERLLEDHCGDCNAPCELSCPAECDIPGFIAAIASDNDIEAVRIIKEDIPLPGILGRVCHAPCEEACRRHGVDDPLSICSLKRFAAERDNASVTRHIPQRQPETGKKVAITGTGPAGLTAGYYLLLNGHDVTFFDAHDAPGGMMRYGIPRFRLPEEAIEADLEPIRAMGGKFECGTVVGRDITLDSMKNDGFDALFLAIGAQLPSPLSIDGEERDGVITGIGFLENVACGRPVNPGKRVLVIGGGNTAIDAARTALRLGAYSVRILYRRSIEEMPANRSEIKEAQEEGIIFDILTAPVSIEKTGNALRVSVRKMALGSPDQSGRKRPVPVAGSDYVIDADTVISAVGQKVDPTALDALGITMAEGGTVQAEEGTFQTAIPWVFAGGDCISGPDTAVNAVRHGRLAARKINEFLRGLPVMAEQTVFNSSYGPRDQVPAAFYDRSVPSPRIRPEELAPDLRTSGFSEVVSNLSAEQARREAERCLSCSCVSKDDCRLRELAADFDVKEEQTIGEEEDFLIDRKAGIRFERTKCIDCGICVRTLEEEGEEETLMRLLAERCPTGALSKR